MLMRPTVTILKATLDKRGGQLMICTTKWQSCNEMGCTILRKKQIEEMLMISTRLAILLELLVTQTRMGTKVVKSGVLELPSLCRVVVVQTT